MLWADFNGVKRVRICNFSDPNLNRWVQMGSDEFSCVRIICLTAKKPGIESANFRISRLTYILFIYGLLSCIL